MRCAGPLSCCSRSEPDMGHVSASERVGSGSGNFLKRRLGEQARASYSAGAHLPTETSSHGGESRRFICSRPLGCLGLRMCALASARPLPARAPACPLGLKRPLGALRSALRAPPPVFFAFFCRRAFQPFAAARRRQSLLQAERMWSAKPYWHQQQTELVSPRLRQPD